MTCVSHSTVNVCPNESGMAKAIKTIQRFVCQRFHKQITRPVNGSYACLDCGQVWPSPWR